MRAGALTTHRTYADMLKDKRDATVMYESALLEQRAGGRPMPCAGWEGVGRAPERCAHRARADEAGPGWRSAGCAGGGQGWQHGAAADLAVLAHCRRLSSTPATPSRHSNTARNDAPGGVRPRCAGRVGRHGWLQAIRRARNIVRKALAGRPGGGRLILAASCDGSRGRRQGTRVREGLARATPERRGLAAHRRCRARGRSARRGGKAYREAARLSPPARALSLARAQMAQGKRAQAVATLETRLQQRDDDAAVRRTLANCT